MVRIIYASSNKSIIAVSLIVFAMLAGIIYSKRRVVAGNNQSNEVSISRKASSREPFDVLDYRIKGKAIKLDERSQVDGDWLSELRFMIRNKSEKPMVFVRVVLAFPETQVDKPIRVYDIEIGQKTGAPIHRSGPIFLRKGDVSNLILTEKQYKRIRDSLENAGFPLGSLTKMEVWIQEVRFADGTMWYVGETFAPDPASPSGWKKVMP